jgi:hypothetical protein
MSPTGILCEGGEEPSVEVGSGKVRGTRATISKSIGESRCKNGR